MGKAKLVIRAVKAAAAFLNKGRFIQSNPCVTDLLEDAGHLSEVRRLKGQSLTAEDRDFILTVRKWAKASGLSENGIHYFEELGKSSARRGR